MTADQVEIGKTYGYRVPRERAGRDLQARGEVLAIDLTRPRGALVTLFDKSLDKVVLVRPSMLTR